MSFNTTIGSFLIASALFLSGCDSIVYNIPTEVSTDRAEVLREDVNLEFDTASLSGPVLQKIAKDYRNRGESSMLVSVTYDPHSPGNTARKASDTAANVAAAINRQGVTNFQVETLPVLESGETSRTLVSYAGLKAVPPSSCDQVLGMEMVDDFDKMEKQKLGCSIETYTARQVTRPADLLGNDVIENSNGRYSANSLERYVSGQPNPALSGENASGE